MGFPFDYISEIITGTNKSNFCTATFLRVVYNYFLKKKKVERSNHDTITKKSFNFGGESRDLRRMRYYLIDKNIPRFELILNRIVKGEKWLHL